MKYVDPLTVSVALAFIMLVTIAIQIETNDTVSTTVTVSDGRTTKVPVEIERSRLEDTLKLETKKILVKDSIVKTK